jgi:acetylornithine deacetylase/succinyl-diaminopimelate desuccinylase family protein
MQETILQAVDARRDDVVELTRQLVAYRSENPKLLVDAGMQEEGRRQEAECQSAIAAHLGELGAEVDRFEAMPGREDVVGTVRGAGGGRSLILNGHVDVVPAGDPSDWPHDPWAGEVADGKLWGRGSCDMKGGLAAGIVALRALRDAGVRLRGDVVFQAVVDEETGGPGTVAAIERGHRADAAIVLEPTSRAIMPVEGGVTWLRVVVRGVSGHSAVRYRTVHAGGRGTAVNAIEKAAKILAAVQELERHWGNRKMHPLMPKGITTINPGVVAGGSGGGADGMPGSMSAYSTMPDYCALGLSLKFLPDERIEDVRRDFEDYIGRVADADPWLRDHPPEIEWSIGGVTFPPSELPLDHPLSVAVADAHRAARGEPEWRGFEAVSDLAWLARAGIPGLLFGPGDAVHAHSSAEYVEVDELVVAARVVALALVCWSGTA